MPITTQGDAETGRARPDPPLVGSTVTYPDGSVLRIGRVSRICGDQAVIEPRDAATGALSPRIHTAAWGLCVVVPPEGQAGGLDDPAG